MQNNLASVLFRSDELNCSVISIKRKGFFAKQPGRALIDTRPCRTREARWCEHQPAAINIFDFSFTSN